MDRDVDVELLALVTKDDDVGTKDEANVAKKANKQSAVLIMVSVDTKARNYDVTQGECCEGAKARSGIVPTRRE